MIKSHPAAVGAGQRTVPGSLYRAGTAPLHSRLPLRPGAVLVWGFWAVNSWMWFRRLLFSRLPLPGGSPFAAQAFLLSLLLLGGAAACAFGGQRGRPPVARSLLCAYGVYAAAAYAPLKPLLVAAPLGLAAAASAALAAYTLSRPIRPLPPVQRRRIRRVRLKKAAAGTLLLFSAGFAVLLAALAVSTLTGQRLLKAAGPPADAAAPEEQTIEGNFEELALLREDRWSALTAQEKLDVLQTVANIEQGYLGLPDALHVSAAELGETPQPVLSSYSDAGHEILLDYDLLLGGTSWELVNCVAHEARHSYQYRLAELYLAADEADRGLLLFRASGADAFAEELTHYRDAAEDLRAYSAQALEQDARAYAAEAEADYRGSVAPPLSALPGAARV